MIGVASSYFLALQGHEVTVLEKNNEVGHGCSYANGGQMSFSHVEPFSSNSSLNLILKAAITPNSFLSVKKYGDKEFLKFLYEFLKNSGEKNSHKISERLFELGVKSREAFKFIIEKEQIDFSQKNDGILHFFTNKKTFEKALKQAEFQAKIGDKIEILTKEDCIKKEPTLHKLYDENKLVGGIFHKNDASGDSFLFTKKLAEICEKKYGVKFIFGAEIKNILTNHKKITGINCSNGVYCADSYVFALGAYGNKLLSGIGISDKILAVKGYSLSIPVNKEFLAPKIALTDPQNKIVYSRIGDIFRAAGTVEISNPFDKNNEKLIEFLQKKVQESFSDFGDLSKAEIWQGIRPFRANSTPLIEECKKYGNLYFNVGHGHLGFSMSCGSAKKLSLLMKN